MTRRAAGSRRPTSHARRPRAPLRRRLRRALPAPGRIAAGGLTVILAAALVAIVSGPWLRVDRVSWAGERFTPQRLLQRTVDPLRGTALLLVAGSQVAAELERLPAVAEARVEATLPGSVRITLVEKAAAFVWQTSAVQLVGGADGTLIGQVALGAELPADVAALPLIDDRRALSRDIIVGDRIDPSTLAAGLRLAEIGPAAVGSKAFDLGVRLTDDDGFLVVSPGPVWQADFGFYPPQDEGELGTLEERVTAQVAAIRTLFSSQPEGQVSWVDARDPGRVYWRP